MVLAIGSWAICSTNLLVDDANLVNKTGLWLFISGKKSNRANIYSCHDNLVGPTDISRLRYPGLSWPLKYEASKLPSMFAYHTWKWESQDPWMTVLRERSQRPCPAVLKMACMLSSQWICWGRRVNLVAVSYSDPGLSFIFMPSTAVQSHLWGHESY